MCVPSTVLHAQDRQPQQGKMSEVSKIALGREKKKRMWLTFKGVPAVI